MTQEKKKILISKELLEAPVGSFFQSIGFVCETIFKNEDLASYSFIVDDYCPEVVNLPRIKLDPEKTYSAEIEKNVRGVFDTKFLNDLSIQKLLKYHFSSGVEFNLIEF